jgi:hypothetical protein
MIFEHCMYIFPITLLFKYFFETGAMNQRALYDVKNSSWQEKQINIAA